jgi:hypothetical protein
VALWAATGASPAERVGEALLEGGEDWVILDDFEMGVWECERMEFEGESKVEEVKVVPES